MSTKTNRPNSDKRSARRPRTTDDPVHIAENLRAHAVPIDSLTPDPANVRRHGDRSIDAIRASLARFGQQKPVVVDASGVLVAGHGMLEAARALGWSVIAAVRSDLIGVDRAAYAIADNRTAELSEWDDDALRAMLEAMPADAVLAAGYTPDEVRAMAETGSAERLDDDVPPPPAKQAVTRTGDLWLLGEHRLLCGDSTSADDIIRLMAGERAALFATDPPYLVDYDGTNHPGSGGKNKDWSGTYGVTWDDADANADLYPKFCAVALQHAVRPDAAWYCWYASKRHAQLEAAWTATGILPHCQIIWVKNRPVVTRTWYMWQHEPCLMGWLKGNKPERVKGEGMRSTVWKIDVPAWARPREDGEEQLSTVWEIDTLPNTADRPEHPTPKPLECFAIPMRQHTRPGEVCFEAFGGSGSQLIAAERLRRRCFACEISPVYVDVIIRRWQAETGREAQLEGGKTWAAVAKSRKVKISN